MENDTRIKNGYTIESVIIVLVIGLFTSVPIFSQTIPDSTQITTWEAFNRSYGGKWIIRWNKQTGTPAFIFGHRTKPYRGTPQEIAKRFLRENIVVLRMKPDISDLIIDKIRVSKNVTHIKLKQFFQGLPVYSGNYSVHIASDGSIHMVNGNYFPDVMVETSPEIMATQAIYTATRALSISDSFSSAPSAELVVYPYRGDFLLVWKVSLPELPRASWECFVDAENGIVISCDDMVLNVNGLGNVYPVDPVNSSLDTDVILSRLNAPGYYLDGTYVKTLNYSGAEAYSSRSRFVYTPPPYDQFDYTHFDEVNVYWHIDRFAHEFWQSLGFPGLSYQIEALVRKDTYDGANFGTDNRLHFGMGGVKYWDTSKKDDVIYHEYSHAVTSDIGLTKGSTGSESHAMHEAYSDYFAGSFNNDYIIGEWVAKDLCCSHLRTLQSSATDYNYANIASPPEYPVAGNPYNTIAYRRSMIWSGALWDLREVLGQWQADFLIYQGLEYVNGNATFEGGRYGILQADISFNNSQNQTTIHNVFDIRGIGDSGPDPPQNLTLSGSAGQNPSVGWESNSEADVVKYWVYRKREGQDNYYKNIATVYVPATTYTDYGTTIGSDAFVYYRIKAVDWIGQASLFSGWVRTRFEEPPSGSRLLVHERIPDEFAVRGNYPNPFNAITKFEYDLPEESFVQLKVSDILGRQVKTLVDGLQAAGYRSVVWDGSDSNGNPISSGVYLYRVSIEFLHTDRRFSEITKIVYLR